MGQSGNAITTSPQDGGQSDHNIKKLNSFNMTKLKDKLSTSA